MKKTYKTMMTTNLYTIAIWDNCMDKIEIRSDGQRMRITVDEMKGDGQGGGSLTDRTFYIDGRENVKLVWRKYRKNQRQLIKQGQSPQHHTALEGCEYSGLTPICGELCYY